MTTDHTQTIYNLIADCITEFKDTKLGIEDLAKKINWWLRGNPTHCENTQEVPHDLTTSMTRQISQILANIVILDSLFGGIEHDERTL